MTRGLRGSGAARALCFVALLAGGQCGLAAAQATGATVRGLVRVESGEPVPYAVVALRPAFWQRFTDQAGGFAFAAVPPGTYRLLARQIGFKPLDTAVVVTAERPPDLVLTLEPLVVQVSAITVTRWQRCTAPGPPDPSLAPELAAVFDQLKQNAERYWLMADSYPVVYRMARTAEQLNRLGYLDLPRLDTVVLRTNARWHYAPGNVVSEYASGRNRWEAQFNLPTLPDLADSAFERTHCFFLAGVDTVAGRRLIRLDFAPDVRLRSPDVDGSAYLDASSFVIRRASVRLTRPGDADYHLHGLTAEVTYREIAPLIVLVDTVDAAREYEARNGVVHMSEHQRLLDFGFLRSLPGSR